MTEKINVKKFISSIRLRLGQRPDSEHRQALLRVLLVGIGAIYAQIIGESFWVFTSLFISVAIFAHILYRPGISPVRRIVGSLQDNIFTTMFLFSVGTSGALYLFVYPFITVGNGFRFGVRYLALSGALSSAGMLFLIFFGPGWSADPTVGAGILISNVLVTLYTGILLKRLNQTQEKLLVMARQDALTGLPNRAVFMDSLDYLIRQREISAHSIICIYFDLDGFKKVNDTFGHKTGDQLLIMVAQKVRNTVRSTDVLARLGGDEFTLLLDAKTTPEDAKKVAARVIKSIESISLVEGQPVKVSASVGIAHLPALLKEPPIISSDALLKLADEQMYCAKQKGKGRLEFMSFEEHPTVNYLKAS